MRHSSMLNQLIEQYILKLIIGPSYELDPNISEKRKQYKEGLFDEMSTMVFIPGDKKYK